MAGVKPRVLQVSGVSAMLDTVAQHARPRRVLLSPARTGPHVTLTPQDRNADVD